MRRSLFAVGLVSALGCDIPVDNDAGVGIKPYRGAWQVEVDQPFDAAAVSRIQIGGPEFQNNFAHRGDVVVQFAEADRITIEARRFAVGRVPEQAEEELEGMSLWAYRSGEVAPARPQDMEFPQPCVGDEMAWPDECVVRMYFDGQAQPQRTGADLRVTLPLAYQGELIVRTEDNDADSNYQNRGDVCIEATHAQVDVELERGLAYVATAAPTEAAPTSSVEVHADAANLTLDVPGGVWSAVDVSYIDYATDEYRRCFADFTLADFVETSAQFGSTGATISGQAAAPSSEPEGTPPLAFRASADECDLVGHTESPEDWVGEGNSADQPSDVRGRIEVCNDCVRGPGCAALLPD